MDIAAIPVLSLTDDPASFSAAIGASFRNFGFAMVRDHGIDADLIARGWELNKAFFALPEEEKRRYYKAEIFGQRGYTPFKTEIAKGADRHDLKEFWHVGRDLAPGSALADSMPANVWPDRPEGFHEVFSALYAAFDAAGATILSRIAVHLGLDAHWFDPEIAEGNSILRLLHYPPIEGATDGAIRAGAHEDINLITLLLGAEEAGLELLAKDGTWKSVAVPPGAMVINIGDMLQRLTNHVLPSTTHRVRNPDAQRAAHSRYSMPFFLHLRSDFWFKTFPQCVSAENPDRYPVSITADDYLNERLREIGLKK
ncbi:isopenicillin N synthase family oxygenase [Novosphingobium sp. FSY-8]|uniref:Isopenicillin N synthase family oxygenase n=1 Tax=Novosphingobium ovatum TaxID=1908523 RepID=A0ABW9XA74_9SPHN|nr:isopenicillin N synthase family oxygenase [Novosphingobium ovatum]NBC35400.1 isopenicillin N synthase family oxygenase [Novosphingobium ovatum]